MQTLVGLAPEPCALNYDAILTKNTGLKFWVQHLTATLQPSLEVGPAQLWPQLLSGSRVGGRRWWQQKRVPGTE